MPLLEGTGITNVGGNFTFFFALVSYEDATSFAWALGQYKNILQENNIPDPEVILSDFDTAFKNAADVVFPDVQQQLCLWHNLKNVVLHIKKKWNGTLGDSKIMGDVESETNADPSRTTGKLCDKWKAVRSPLIKSQGPTSSMISKIKQKTSPLTEYPLKY